MIRVNMTEALPFVYLYEPPKKEKKKTIRNVVIHKSVQTIHPNAFQNCHRLVEVDFAEGLQIIHTVAFEKCTALESVSLPSTVTKIGKYAFRQCLSLSEVQLPRNGSTFDIEIKAFEGCRSLCAISFPSNNTGGTVGYAAFANCTSLLSVEIPTNSKMKFARNVFQGCHQLVNVSIPMQMPSTTEKCGTEKCFVTCASLQKCYPACDFPEALIDRYFKLPLHSMCYHASTTKLSDLKEFIKDKYNNKIIKYNAVDRWGMTAYHILATGAILRKDLLQTLMDRYPLQVILQKDRNGKTMLDYLLLYKSTKSIPVVQMVIRRLLKVGMGNWGLVDWRNDVLSLVEASYNNNSGSREVLEQHHRLYENAAATTEEVEEEEESSVSAGAGGADWEETLEQRSSSFHEITSRLAVFGRKEVTSLMELALWKMKIVNTTTTASEMNRMGCRVSCGSEFVIPHVVGYLWHDDEPPSNGLMYLNLHESC
mmetsp:Transcript_44305/g.106731  ORF Transcript_44305/g.106731 Transcript_44305/m.106731 type:complete len:481 (+) Transcript_44305:78-1520(+)